MSSTQVSQRKGAYREEALAHYGEVCQDCDWVPESEAEQHKLHVHHENPHGDGGPDAMENLAVLCRDCRFARLSETSYSHELVGRLTRTLAGQITHKRDGFVDRVARRVRLDTVHIIDGVPPENPFAEVVDQYTLVEGVTEGDHYDSYFVDTTQPYLSMCTCYEHSFGVHRAHNICTHVAATIVRHALSFVDQHSEERAMAYIREKGSELNEKAKEYVEKQELIEKSLDTLDIADEYSDSWEQRASAQAKKMTQYGEEWKCFGSECEGCEVRLTTDGYTCTDAQDKGWENKFPCPGKLGAHILNETGGQTVYPDIENGHVFEVRRERSDLPAKKGEFLIALEIDEDEEEATFRRFEDTGVTIDFETLADTILAGTLRTTRESQIEKSYTCARVIRDSNGYPDSLGPDVDIDDVYHVRRDTNGVLTKGDTLTVTEYSDDTRRVRAEYINPNEPFVDGDEVTLRYEEMLEYLRDGVLDEAYVSNVVDVICTETTQAYGKTKVALYSSEMLREDMMELDWDDTHRSWNDPIQGKWNVDAEALDMVIDHLQNCGWTVWIPSDIREEVESVLT